MFFLFYKFLFFLSDFLEIQRKSFYLFLNELLSQEFLKIQPLYNFRKRTIYKNLKLPSLWSAASPRTGSEGTSGPEGPVQSTRLSSTNPFEKALKKNDHDFADGVRLADQALINNPLEGRTFESRSQTISPIARTTLTPKDPTNDRITTIYFLSNNYKFIKPTLNIEESILFSKTYCCHFYIPVKLFDNSTHFTEIRWIFLGTLPLLTRRGHFIINGTPRIVLNQIIRSPGIYFHKGFSRGKGSSLFYAEIISKSGPWVRLEIDQKKRIWVSFQQMGPSAKTKNPLSHFFRHFYQKYLDHHILLNEKKSPTLDAILLNEFFWKDVFFKEPKNKIEANIQYSNKTGEAPVLGQRGARGRCLSAGPALGPPPRPKQRPASRAQPLADRSRHRWVGLGNKSEPSQVFFQKLWKKFQRWKTEETTVGRLASRPPAGALGGSWENRDPLFFSKNGRSFCPSLFIYFKIGSFDQYYSVETGARVAGPSLRPMTAKVSPPSRRTTQKQKSNLKSKTFRIGSDILFASSSKNGDLGLNLSPSGRRRLNQRLGLSLKTLTLTPIDFLTISDILYQWVQDGHHPNIMAEKIPFDDIDDLKNRRLKTIGELLQNQLARGIQRLQKTFENTVQKDWIKFLNHQTYNSSLSFLNDFHLNRKKNWSATRTPTLPGSPGSELGHPKQLYYLLTKLHFKRNFLWKELFLYQKTGRSLSLTNPPIQWLTQKGKRRDPDFVLSTSILSLINSLSINSTFKEFFHSHQLSQFLDQSNPLAEITHKRRLSCLGSGGITRETAGMEIRGIHLSHYGRICPIETPEGKNAGLVNSLTTTVHVNYQGFLETPYVEIYKQHYQNQKKLMFFSVENQEFKKVFLNPKLPKLRNISVGIIKPQTQNFYKFKIDYMNLVAFHPIQFLSIATTCIPFIEHDDANRALMGSNMQRQALPLIHLEQPIVTTFNTFRVLSDLKDIPITSESGMILYVSQQKISYYCLHFRKKVQTMVNGIGPRPGANRCAGAVQAGWAFVGVRAKDLKLPYRLKVDPPRRKVCRWASAALGRYEDSKLGPLKRTYQLF